MTTVVVEPPRTYWTAADLMRTDFPEPRWAVPNLIPEGVTLLAGQPKVGKSWLALNLAVSVAAGGKALGRVHVQRGPVLYLALEDTARRLKSRLRKVLGDTDAPNGLAFDTAWPTLSDGGAERLRRWLEAHRDARLVIIDVFARIRGTSDRNANQYDIDYQAMGQLKALADEYQVPVVVVHHTRKASSDDFLNEVSGTNGLAGSADAVLVLKRARGKADAELKVTGRDIDEADHALTFDPANGRWTMLDGPASDYTLGDTRAAILRHLRTVPGATPKAIAEATGMNHETVKKACARMADDDQLDTDGQGTYFTPLSPVPDVPDVPAAGQSTRTEGHPHSPTVPLSPGEGHEGHEGHLFQEAS